MGRGAGVGVGMWRGGVEEEKRLRGEAVAGGLHARVVCTPTPPRAPGLTNGPRPPSTCPLGSVILPPATLSSSLFSLWVRFSSSCPPSHTHTHTHMHTHARTCSASTSCLQSSPTLKMQARLRVSGGSGAGGRCSTLKATRMGTCAG